MAGYITKLLGRNEQIVFKTRLHPIIYLLPVALIAAGIFSLVTLVSSPPAKEHPDGSSVLMIVLVLFIPVGLVWLFAAWIRRRSTEIAVTNRRIVYKRGWFARNTIEINFKHIESVDIKQPVLGRILNYGTVVIRGTGIGVQPMRSIAKPLELRNAAFDQAENPA